MKKKSNADAYVRFVRFLFLNLLLSAYCSLCSISRSELRVVSLVLREVQIATIYKYMYICMIHRLALALLEKKCFYCGKYIPNPPIVYIIINKNTIQV